MDSCGANLPCTFFTFSKRTVDEIDKYIGFWYNKRKKRRICRCTLPMQGLLQPLFAIFYFFGQLHLTYAGIITVITVGTLASLQQLHLTYAGIITGENRYTYYVNRVVAPYLCRDYYRVLFATYVTFFPVAPYLCRYYYTIKIVQSNLAKPVAPYLCRDYYFFKRIICALSCPLVAPYLCRYPKAKLPRVSLFFCHPTLPRQNSCNFAPAMLC